MNYVENNGKKVAAAVAVASTIPVIGTVYAMETQPGWHGDKFVNTDSKIAKGWQEIEGKSYYFREDDGTVDREASKDAVVASVSADVVKDVVKEVTTSTVTAVQETATDQEETVVSQSAVEVASAPEEEVYTEVVAENPPVASMEEVAQDAQESVNVETTPVVTPEVTPEATPEVTPEVAPESTPEVTPEVTPEATPEVTPAPVETPSTPQQSANPYAQLNQNIANAAINLVGVTNGQWCTQVVQQALANAGVQDAYQLWPDQYAGQYGYYTDTPEAGNLVYYYNGGRGVDHIAIYIGDGMAVHGNYGGNPGEMGNTVISSVYVNGGQPQYIQVCR